MIARFHDEGRFVAMRLAATDIEEFIARAGWTALNGATKTPEDERAIATIEAKGYAEMPERTWPDYHAWWSERVICSYCAARLGTQEVTA